MHITSVIEIDASEHPIKSVAIFKSLQAGVVRTFKLDLKAGQNKVEIEGLPGTIDTHSVRVSNLGDARLLDVVYTIDTKKKGASYASNSPSIRSLKVQKQTLESEKHVREQEIDLLAKYGKTFSAKDMNTTSMLNFLDHFVEQGCRNSEIVAEINEKIFDIDRQIENEVENSASQKGGTRGKVNIVLGTNEAATVDIKLIYVVSGVHWQPAYELHATTENGEPSPSISFDFRARITQSTGEDWANTALTLNTMSLDTTMKSIPQLQTIRMQEQPTSSAQDKPFFGFSTQDTAGSNSGGQSGPLSGQQNTAPIVPPQQQHTFGSTAAGIFSVPRITTSTAPQQEEPAVRPQTLYHSALSPEEGRLAAYGAQDPPIEPTTHVMETPISISYSISGGSTIPSDGIEHQVSVAVLPFQARISYVVLPRIDPRVYLHYQVTNTSEYRLIPGPVRVIVNDNSVSKTFINDVNTGDSFDCILGDDPAIKVVYARSSHTVEADGGAYFNTMDTTTYTTNITIHNKHAFDVLTLAVRDILPICDDWRAKIMLKRPQGLAGAKDGEEIVVNEESGLSVMWERGVDGRGGSKEGRYEWRGSIKARDRIVLESEWDIRGPTNTTWAEVY